MLGGVCSRAYSCRHLLQHLGFEDVLEPAPVPADNGGLAAAAEALQLTSPSSAVGTSAAAAAADANGNAFADEGETGASVAFMPLFFSRLLVWSCQAGHALRWK
jgi:hypothetical protein